MMADCQNEESVKSKRRKSYRRETKLNVIKWFYDNGCNVSLTSRTFNIDRKVIREWIKSEEKINNQKEFTRKEKSGRKASYPLMEGRLHQIFLEVRKDGKICKRWLFIAKAKQLMAELYPTVATFRYSEKWFRSFRQRYGISWRKKTHTAQKSPAEASLEIKQFHQQLLRLRLSGTYQTKDIANMDQTPLPFILDDGLTYDELGAKSVWCASGPSGKDKRMCTVQITIFADGVPRVKPLLIFRGKGLRIQKKERDQYDKRVRVVFQPNAWCDEPTMKDWINTDWNNFF